MFSVRILLTTHQYLPEYFSGTEILTRDTARALKGMGHEVRIFTGYPVQGDIKDVQRFDSYIYEDIEVERFKHSHVPMGGQSNVVEAEYNCRYFAQYFEAYLRRVKPDIVHFFHLGRLSASAVEVCERFGIPTVLTPTDFWLICPTCQLRLPDNSLCTGPDLMGQNCLRHIVANTQPDEIKRKVSNTPSWLLVVVIFAIRMGFFTGNKYAQYVRALSERPRYLRAQMKKIDCIFHPTKIMEQMLKKNNIKPKMLKRLPYGINTNYIQRSVRDNKSNPIRVGYIGGLAEHKGIHILIKALNILKNESIETKIYGGLEDSPDYVDQLYELAGDDKRVKFFGSFPNEEIGTVLNGIDVLVVPSIWYENTPLVIYSAQAAGCPIIASDVGGISEVVKDSVNGLLFPAGDPQALALALKTLSHDRDLLKQMAERAIEPLSAERYASALLKTYTDLVSHKRELK